MIAVPSTLISEKVPIQFTIFEESTIRRINGDATATWWFPVGNIIQALTHQVDYQTEHKYWSNLRERLGCSA